MKRSHVHAFRCSTPFWSSGIETTRGVCACGTCLERTRRWEAGHVHLVLTIRKPTPSGVAVRVVEDRIVANSPI